MSGLSPGTPPANTDAAGNDPSMEDILASIRRILNEDETAPATPAAEPAAQATEQPNAGGSGGEDDGVLVLDEAMLVTPNAPAQLAPPPLAPPPAPALPKPPVQVPVTTAAHVPQPATIEAEPNANLPDASLLAPTSAAAAAASVGSLLRTLANERTSQVYRGGPTIEDLVREELRPLLKVWLDEHLPPMVERVVRQEIERLTGQTRL